MRVDRFVTSCLHNIKAKTMKTPFYLAYQMFLITVMEKHGEKLSWKSMENDNFLKSHGKVMEFHSIPQTSWKSHEIPFMKHFKLCHRAPRISKFF
jgi:hypothetical protein